MNFGVIVVGDLAPMLQAVVTATSIPSTAREDVASYASPIRLVVKPLRASTYRLQLSRSQPFSAEERGLAGGFIKELGRVLELPLGGLRDEVLNGLPRRVVAGHIGGGPLLRSTLQRLEEWSSQTYEGQRVVAAIGLDTVPARTGVDVARLWTQSYGPVMSNGYDTLVVVGSDGEVFGVEPLNHAGPSTAPYRLGGVASWASQGRVAIVLNRHGEILVFQNASLTFARRRGRWVHFTHEASIARLVPPRNRFLREAIYESCLDVSFARTGGCIGVVGFSQTSALGPLVSPDDLLEAQRTYKTEFPGRTVRGAPFQALDRRVRLELLSMDGAVIVNHRGQVLAAGAIVNIRAGSLGGGRTAAAMRMSESGLGIKVSADGPITAYKSRDEILRA